MPLSDADIIQSNTGSFQGTSGSATLPAGTTAGNTVLIFLVADAPMAATDGFFEDAFWSTNVVLLAFRRSDVPADESSWTLSTQGSSARLAWIAYEVQNLALSPFETSAVAGDLDIGSGETISTGETGQNSALDTVAFGVWGAMDLNALTVTAPTFDNQTNGFAEQDEQSLVAGGQAVDVCTTTMYPGAIGPFETTATVAFQATHRGAAAGLIVVYRSATSPTIDPLIVFTGFETGTTAGWTTGNAGNKMFDSVTGTPTITAGSARSGSYGLEVSASAATEGVTWTTATYGSSRAVMVGFVAFRFPTSLPSGNVDIVDQWMTTAANDLVIRHRVSDHVLVVCDVFGGDLVAGDVTVVSDTWYLLDWRLNVGGTTHTMDWRINGVTQPQWSRSSSAEAVSQVSLGPVSNAATATVHYDDWCLSVTTGDYPLGEHKVRLLKPDTTGTATESGTANATSTFTANATVGTTFNSANLLSRTSEVPPVIGASADGWAQRTAGATNWANIPLTTYALAGGETIAALRAVIIGWAATATTNNVGFRAYNGTTEETFFPLGDPNFSNSTTVPAWLCRLLTPANYDTQAELDAVVMRAGFATDVSPVPGAHFIGAEVAIKVSAGGGASIPAQQLQPRATIIRADHW